MFFIIGLKATFIILYWEIIIDRNDLTKLMHILEEIKHQ